MKEKNTDYESTLHEFNIFLETEKNLKSNSKRMYICDIKAITRLILSGASISIINKHIEKIQTKKHFKRIATSIKTFIEFYKKKYKKTLNFTIPHIKKKPLKKGLSYAKPCKIQTLTSTKRLKKEQEVIASCIVSMIYFEHIRPNILQKICKDDVFLDQNIIVIRKEQSLKIPIITQHTKTLLEKALTLHAMHKTPLNCPLFFNKKLHPISTRHMYNLAQNQKVLHSPHEKKSCHNFFIAGLIHSIQEGLSDTLIQKHIPQYAVKRLKSLYKA